MSCVIVNDKKVEIPAETGTLLEMLRENLGLTGAKKACDNGECGSCIVLMNGKPTKSCLLQADRAADKTVLTVEGLAPEAMDLQTGDDYSVLHPIQQAFLAKGATQCGFCIPGMIMKTHELLARKPNPTHKDIVKGLSTNLCRCTGYTKIIEAVRYAADLISEKRNAPEPEEPNGRAVGVNVARLDSPSTVNGAAKYGADLRMDGMLYGKLLRSEHHHARILSIDVSEAVSMKGVSAVVTADDIPGTTYLPNCQPQVYVFPKDRIRFKGEALAGVAAISEKIASEALKKIKVKVEVLPHAIEIKDAVKSSATPLYNHSPRVSKVEEVSCGDIDKGFAKSDVIVENDYTVPMREHAAMEPECALAYQEGTKLVIRTGLYHAFVQGTKSIANNLAMKEEDIQIICPAMGGNFGTRGDTLIAVTAGLMTKVTGLPVRIVFSRAESILGSCKAPSVNMHFKTGATRDGRIVALDAEILHGTGSWAPFLIDKTTKGLELCYYETLSALLSHVTGPYDIPNVRARAWDVMTNGPRYVPLRGTNGNYLPLAYESQVNLLAEKLQIDPIDIRLQNSIRTGSKIPTGQTLTESVSMVKELEALKPYYEEAKKRIQKKKGKVSDAWRPGLGVACGWRNIGYLKTTISAGCELDDNGMVHVMAGTVEQGQGPTTQFAQIAADSVGVSMKSVRVTLGDTLSAPYPVPTFSSITTVGTGKAVQIASEMLRKRICYAASEILNVEHSLIKIENDCVRLSNSETEVSLLEIAEYFKDKGEKSLSESEIKWSGEAPTILYGYNAGLIELEVNIKTGQVILLNHVNVCDPGTRINPDAVDGQIDGAIAFGVGFGLSEEFHPDNPPTLKDYGLVSINQIPKEVTRLYVEDPLERGPFGAKSMAEHPGLSITPAIVNGIADATGAWVCDIPATPDRVMAKMAVV
jgi:CO/xanthine dehydrogenase Mo-binding subunit/aerobic-type carbon monoxide dehydrogenase small subunit (CoxS/CutS family)